MISSGTPASSRRSSSAAQSAGRYRARPIRACPAGAAQVRVTATWHIAIPPTVPLYWRAAPAQLPRTSRRRSRPRSAPRRPRPGLRKGAPAAQSAAASSICWSSQRARDSRCCIRYGLACPAASASVQQLRSSSSDSRPCTMSRQVSRVSRRAKHGATRAIRSSSRSACASWSTWRQRLPCDCLVPQTGMITAAAPAFRVFGHPLPACQASVDAPPATGARDLQLCRPRSRSTTAVTDHRARLIGGAGS